MLQQEESSPERSRKLIILSSVLFVTAGGVTWYMLSGKSAAEISAVRVYICSETGKSFEHKIKEGEEEPVYSPYSGKNTGYAAEACYWTKGPDGKWAAKLTPTYVLLEQVVHPGSKKKTFCPDCGHEVTGHNRLPPEKLMQAAREQAGLVKKD